MPCMCGDIQCPSCGPAQGNWKCIICGQWADDPCEHLDEMGQPSDNNPWGAYKPEFQELARQKMEEFERALDQYVEDVTKAIDDWKD